MGATGRTVDGGGGINNIQLTFSGMVNDADFTGVSHLNELDIVGASAGTMVLGGSAKAAFGGNVIMVKALNAAVINVDGHGLDRGYLAVGARGADSFIGGAGNDTMIGKGGADLFVLDQGGDTTGSPTSSTGPTTSTFGLPACTAWPASRCFSTAPRLS